MTVAKSAVTFLYLEFRTSHVLLLSVPILMIINSSHILNFKTDFHQLDCKYLELII